MRARVWVLPLPPPVVGSGGVGLDLSPPPPPPPGALTGEEMEAGRNPQEASEAACPTVKRKRWASCGWVGGWVGGWVEEEDTVGMSYCE